MFYCFCIEPIYLYVCYNTYIQQIQHIFGAASNPLPAYQSYINSDVPVIILMEGAKGTSAAYPNGFGDHTVCGTGYYVGSAGQFVIVHTTQCEGDVYVAYSEAALGNFAWFIVY